MAGVKSQSTSILDPTSINALRDLSSGSDSNFIYNFIDLYKTNSAAMVEEIRSHAEVEASGPLRAAAHKLRGSSLNIGGMQVAAVCGDLEKKAKKNDMSNVMEMVELLEDAYEALLEELAAVRAE